MFHPFVASLCLNFCARWVTFQSSFALQFEASSTCTYLRTTDVQFWEQPYAQLTRIWSAEKNRLVLPPDWSRENERFLVNHASPGITWACNGVPLLSFFTSPLSFSRVSRVFLEFFHPAHSFLKRSFFLWRALSVQGSRCKQFFGNYPLHFQMNLFPQGSMRREAMATWDQISSLAKIIHEARFSRYLTNVLPCFVIGIHVCRRWVFRCFGNGRCSHSVQVIVCKSPPERA